METKQVRGVKVLLPSEDKDAVTTWPHSDRLEGEKITNGEYRSLDLSSHRWKDVAVSRARFVDCRMMGFAASGGSFTDILFEGCQLDYSEFSRIRVKGSVAFVRCKFTEAIFRDSDLSGVVFADCVLRNAEFESTKMRNTDLRGNEISGIKGLSSLTGAEVTGGQLTILFESMASELQLKVSEL